MSLSPQLPRQGSSLSLNMMKPSSQVRNDQRWRKQEVREVERDGETETQRGHAEGKWGRKKGRKKEKKEKRKEKDLDLSLLTFIKKQLKIDRRFICKT